MKWLKWSLAAAGLFVGAGVVTFALVGGAGLASAQTPTPPIEMHEMQQGKMAERLGMTPEELKAKRDAMIDQAVANGRLTQEEGDKLKAAEMGEHRGLGRRIAHGIKNVFAAAADVIGISQEDLKTEVQSGKSLSQVASEHNVTRDDLKSGVTTAVQAQIQTALTEGTITQDQADRLNQALTDHLDDLIDHTGGKAGFGHHH